MALQTKEFQLIRTLICNLHILSIGFSISLCRVPTARVQGNMHPITMYYGSQCLTSKSYANKAVYAYNLFHINNLTYVSLIFINRDHKLHCSTTVNSVYTVIFYSTVYMFIEHMGSQAIILQATVNLTLDCFLDFFFSRVIIIADINTTKLLYTQYQYADNQGERAVPIKVLLYFTSY